MAGQDLPFPRNNVVLKALSTNPLHFRTKHARSLRPRTPGPAENTNYPGVQNRRLQRPVANHHHSFRYIISNELLIARLFQLVVTIAPFRIFAFSHETRFAL